MKNFNTKTEPMLPEANYPLHLCFPQERKSPSFRLSVSTPHLSGLHSQAAKAVLTGLLFLHSEQPARNLRPEEPLTTKMCCRLQWLLYVHDLKYPNSNPMKKKPLFPIVRWKEKS